MRLLRRWRFVLLPLLGVVLVAVAWAGWQAWHVNKALNGAVDDVNALKAALEAGNTDEVDAAMADLRAHSTDAADRTSGSTWSVLTWLPVFGDDARGVRVVSDVIADLGGNGFQPLVEAARDLDQLLPRDGGVSIEAVRALQQPVAAGRAALSAAEARLDEEDPTGFVTRLRQKYRDLDAEVTNAHHFIGAADTALEILPSMLGADERREYLLVFQNNAEIRATGGLPGAVSLLEAEGGRVELTRQVAANSFGETDEPVLPLTPAERELYGPQLGTYFLDANFTPDFPRTADLMKARWEQEYDEGAAAVTAWSTTVCGA